MPRQCDHSTDLSQTQLVIQDYQLADQQMPASFGSGLHDIPLRHLKNGAERVKIY